MCTRPSAFLLIGAPSMVETCDWVRQPDSKEPFETHRVRAIATCNGLTVTGPYQFYPDYCPGCNRKVVWIGFANDAGAKP